MITFGSFGPPKNDFDDNELVCHCFQYTKKQIAQDYIENGRSTILERIVVEKEIGGCDCAQRNPKGR
jgi:glutathione synthase/RimK-type ligase-like ATP-grasp enzyme